jgi:putative ATP-dependent endonuclease of OLD family
MRLRQFSISKFRSITKADKLPIGDFTVLIGPNNEGKTNILEALAMGMNELENPTKSGFRGASRRRFRSNYERAEELRYDWARDYPQDLQDKADGRTTMNFDFELTPAEVEEFFDEVGSRFNDALPISLSWGATGRPRFQVRKRGPAQKSLSEKREAIAQFVAARVQLQYVPAVRTGNRVSSIVQRMLAQELAGAAQDPEYAEALTRVQELQEPILENLSQSIARQLQAFLPDVSEVSIEHEQDRAVPRGVAIVVDDGVATDLAFKGDGVQSLAALAMMQHYSRETAQAREFILAVEEPEAHLHPRAIHALRETLRETAEKQQVVVTTHSPLLINRLDLGGNIVVTKNQATPATSVQQVREVLGVQVSDNLEAAEVVLVVEGEEDKTSLGALLPILTPALAPALRDGILAIRPLYGAGNIAYRLAQLRDSLAAIHAFLDDDRAGRQAAEAAQEAGLITEADTTMTMCQGSKKGSEFEDLVDVDLYRERFRVDFGVDLDHPWTGRLSRGKWSERMAVVFKANGKPWNKNVAARAKSAISLCVEESPDTALASEAEFLLSALGSALVDKLENRS